MKDKKLEANLSMVASRVMAGLNMNGLKFLLPLWLGALTGVTVRCVFAAVAFWITSWFVKEAPVTRRQRIGLFCLGAFGLYGFMFCYLLGISKTTPVSSAIFNSMQPIWVFLISVFFLHEKATLMKIIGIALGFGGALLCILTQGSDDLAHDAFTGNMLCMVSSLVFAVYLIVSKKLLEEVGVVTMMKYIFGGAAVTGLIVSSIIGWDAPLLTDALHGDGTGCRGRCWRLCWFSHLPQLLSGSGGLEASQDDGCSHVQLSDTGGDYRCFPHLGARPFQLDASRCHCHDLYQRVLC